MGCSAKFNPKDLPGGEHGDGYVWCPSESDECSRLLSMSNRSPKGENLPYGEPGVSGGFVWSHILKFLFRIPIWKQRQHRSWMAFFTESTFKCWSWPLVLMVILQIDSRLSASVPVRGSRRPWGRMPEISTEMVKFNAAHSKVWWQSRGRIKGVSSAKSIGTGTEGEEQGTTMVVGVTKRTQTMS